MTSPDTSHEEAWEVFSKIFKMKWEIMPNIYCAYGKGESKFYKMKLNQMMTFKPSYLNLLAQNENSTTWLIKDCNQYSKA